jgi:prepilin-type N-terminal cleavage/methylation domain-containing protein
MFNMVGKKWNSKGFTLVEMLIVIALIGILAAALVEKMDAALAQARDTRRKADMRKLQSALMTYYARNQQFPATGVNWYVSEIGAGGIYRADWIPNLAPTFIPVLPHDPRGGKTTNTNAWCINTGKIRSFYYKSDGQNYKLGSYCSQETTWDATDPFYDTTPGNGPIGWMVCSGEPACSTW